jgi:hypothetical protein
MTDKEFNEEVNYNTSKNEKENDAKWIELGNFIYKRLKEPLRHPEFIFYFLFVVICIGACEIWSSIYIENQATLINHKNIIVHIICYSIAIISSGAIELFFIESENYPRKPIVPITIFLFLVCIVFFFLSFIVIEEWGYIFGALSVIFSLIIWWIGNAENSNLTDKSFFSLQSDKSKELSKALDGYEE